MTRFSLPSSPAADSPGDPRLLAALSRLSPDQLDALVGRWLRARSLHDVRLFERRGRISTYEARLGPLETSVHVRVCLRLHALGVHPVEAFLGHLVRTGSSLGLLVTTGECKWAATLAARFSRVPSLRLYSGEDWARELAALGLLGPHDFNEDPFGSPSNPHRPRW